MSETHVNEAESQIPAAEVSEEDLESVSGGTATTAMIGPLIIISIPPDALVPPTDTDHC